MESGQSVRVLRRKNLNRDQLRVKDGSGTPVLRFVTTRQVITPVMISLWTKEEPDPYSAGAKGKRAIAGRGLWLQEPLKRRPKLLKIAGLGFLQRQNLG